MSSTKGSTRLIAAVSAGALASWRSPALRPAELRPTLPAGALASLHLASTLALASWASLTLSALRRWRWPQFISGEFAIAVLIEGQQRLGRLGDFIGGKFSVSVEIEGFQQWIRRRPMSAGRPKVIAAVLSLIADGQRQDGRSSEEVSGDSSHKCLVVS